MLYAAAAALEGCSFVNGGSQNTLCAGLAELAQQRGAYVLGTDFKAGQTKSCAATIAATTAPATAAAAVIHQFKTAAVEYIRSMGLTPKVIASSNHLGNNDMRNLTSKRTLDAKMRVKSNIFEPWQEDIDHQVIVSYCDCAVTAHQYYCTATAAVLTPVLNSAVSLCVKYSNSVGMSCALRAT
eukprot:8565-Heterococcus_DN1.PRE.6